jgi:hypothetical protein
VKLEIDSISASGHTTVPAPSISPLESVRSTYTWGSTSSVTWAIVAFEARRARLRVEHAGYRFPCLMSTMQPWSHRAALLHRVPTARSGGADTERDPPHVGDRLRMGFSLHAAGDLP